MSTIETTESQTHEPGMTFDVDDRFTTPCSCGLAFTSKTPSHAQSRQRSHAEKEAKSSGTTAKTAIPIARAKVCGCGCGEPLAPKAGGLFRSGHDARFKSMLTEANSAGHDVPHPLTAEPQHPLDIARWLDERRGGGTFWQDKVKAGHKPQPERKSRPVRAANDPVAENKGAARTEKLMAALAARRAAAGDQGIVTLRNGDQRGARVVRRENDDALRVVFLDGPTKNQQVIVADHRFEKKGK